MRKQAVKKPKREFPENTIKFSGTINGFSFEVYLPEVTSNCSGLDYKLSHSKAGIEIKKFENLEQWDNDIELNQLKINTLKQIKAMVSSLKTMLN